MKTKYKRKNNDKKKRKYTQNDTKNPDINTEYSFLKLGHFANKL